MATVGYSGRMKKTLTAALTALVLVTTLACGLGSNKGKCHLGDTRKAHGHTDVCGKDGKWFPMTKEPIKR